jgi:hypothetical protein
MVERVPMLALVILAILFGILPAVLMGQMSDWTTSALAALSSATGGA